VDGHAVRVFNGRGATVLPARVTDRIAPGVVAIKEGVWFSLDARGDDTRGCANMLTPDTASPAGASPFNTCFVEIAPA
jgi:anaerobic dimethyl sulfoxide reductase subunit A